MTGREVFKIWSPAGVKWVDWARPVPFVGINDSYKINRAMNFTIPIINYINNIKNDTAIVLDLPGYDSVKEGIALAALGYRPIPLYNGTCGQQGAMALVDNHSIESALIWGALELEKFSLANNAPPAFLLDSNRMSRFKMDVSVFDNSWDVYHQDMPSAGYFLDNGIEQIIVKGEKIQKDLLKVLYKHQNKGITIAFTDGYQEPKKVTIKKPSRKDK
ncbi:MAG: hypothetical protein FWH01_00365 [Oscillospiraceae bacterium]|nr:hypothetical protein [Oscillospiraceae bacterium]